MTPAEHRRRYGAVPEWRRPLWRQSGAGVVSMDAEARQRERMSLRNALLEVAGCHTPMTTEQLRAAIREDWGDTSDAAIDRERDELERDGDLTRVPGGWARTDDTEEE